jgi:hypothetical protein
MQERFTLRDALTSRARFGFLDIGWLLCLIWARSEGQPDIRKATSRDGKMKRAALRVIGISRSVLLFALLLAAGLVAIGLWAFRVLLPPPPASELTGTYHADDGGIYYVQRSSNILWWVGMSLDNEPSSADFQWHRGLDSTNV